MRCDYGADGCNQKLLVNHYALMVESYYYNYDSRVSAYNSGITDGCGSRTTYLKAKERLKAFYNNINTKSLSAINTIAQILTYVYNHLKVYQILKVPPLELDLNLVQVYY
jgi:hypothetical protein